MLEDLFVGADSPIKGQVATFADLPTTGELGDLFVVKTTTGVIGINRKIKGLYRWDGAAWVFADGIEANKVIYNNADSSLSAGTVKAAIDELDTKRQDATNLTSGTLPEARLPTIDADNTTVSNLEVDNLKPGVLDTDLSSVSANDDTLASAKAIKDYVDSNAPVNADWNATSGDAEILNKPTTITSAERAKLGNISVTQAVDLDTMESNIATNNAKVTNATHTGDVTGSTALTIANDSVSNAKLANVATGTIKGRTSAGAGNVEDLDIDTTLKSALNLTKSDVGLNNVPNTNCTNASNITSGTLNINRLPSGIDADSVDGLDASQFLRSDVGDTIDVGRGAVYLENSSKDNQGGAGLTIRTSSNPANGDPGVVGSIFAIRSSGKSLRFWVGQSKTTTGGNDFVTNDATFNGNVTIESGNNYYMSNNANIFHGINSTNVTPTATDTSYYAIFDTTAVTNTDIYSYTAPTASSNTGIKLLKAGKYKVAYTLNWENASYNNRVNFYSFLVKHSSAITPTETELAGSRSFGYARDDNFASFATTTNVTVIDVVANEFIKCKTLVAKNGVTFDDDFTGLRYYMNSSIVIEYLGNI